jgi:hypothetical protein
MPSVLTHYGFNKEVFDDKVSFLRDNEDIYLVGAQGPDPFFFYGIIPFLGDKNGKEIRKYGTKLHKMDPFKVFEFFLEYANAAKEKDVLYAYILGAGLHYILDRKIHPYVFYRTGFSDDKKMKKKYFVDHTMFETNLDVLLMNDRYKNYKVKPVDSIRCDEEKIEDVSEMYEKLAKEIVIDDSIDDDSFEDSYDHMCKIENILYSKKGIKKGIASFLFKSTPLNTMMHPLRVKDADKIDYLNLKKDKWQDPETETFHEKSLYDLIEEAKFDAEEWFDLIQDAYSGKKVNLEEFTKGFIYDGNKEGKKMKVFKSVYEKERL